MSGNTRNNNKLVKTILSGLQNSLSQALINTQNKKMKQQLLLEICKIKMLDKYDVKDLSQSQLITLFTSVKQAISLDNWFCLKSKAYEAAIDHFIIATNMDINKLRLRTIPKNSSYQILLYKILNTLYNLVTHQQLALNETSQKHNELNTIAIKIKNIHINSQYNNNSIQINNVKNIVKKVRATLGKHTRYLFPYCGIAHGSKVCEPELKRLEEDISKLNLKYAGPLY
jgi:hypothetical protein